MEKSRTVIYITLFILFFLELVTLNKLRFFGVRPELLLIFTIFFGFHFGIARGLEIGLVCGLLKDTFGMANLGINIFSFLLVGLLAGFLKNKIFKENFITQFLLSAGAVCLVSVIHLFYIKAILHYGMEAEFWGITLRKGLYTALITPIFFVIFTGVFGRREGDDYET